MAAHWKTGEKSDEMHFVLKPSSTEPAEIQQTI